MDTVSKFIAPGIVFLLALASGVWLSRAGKPLNIHYRYGASPLSPKTPFVPGYEILGAVDAVGEKEKSEHELATIPRL